MFEAHSEELEESAGADNLKVKEGFLRGDYTILPDAILADNNLASTTKLVLMGITSHIRKQGGGKCFPSEETLARKTALSVRTDLINVSLLVSAATWSIFTLTFTSSLFERKKAPIRFSFAPLPISFAFTDISPEPLVQTIGIVFSSFSFNVTEIFFINYPTDPTISSCINLFSSNAYSKGNSLTIGSIKPFTIIEVASFSERPRLIK